MHNGKNSIKFYRWGPKIGIWHEVLLCFVSLVFILYLLVQTMRQIQGWFCTGIFQKRRWQGRRAAHLPGTHPVWCQHIFHLLLFVLNVPLEGVSFQKEQLEEGKVPLSWTEGWCGLSARRDGRRAALAHKLKLLDWWEWTMNKRETAGIKTVQKTMRTCKEHQQEPPRTQLQANSLLHPFCLSFLNEWPSTNSRHIFIKKGSVVITNTSLYLGAVLLRSLCGCKTCVHAWRN